MIRALFADSWKRVHDDVKAWWGIFIHYDVRRSRSATSTAWSPSCRSDTVTLARKPKERSRGVSRRRPATPRRLALAPGHSVCRPPRRAVFYAIVREPLVPPMATK
jgi:hypothetical protein